MDQVEKILKRMNSGENVDLIEVSKANFFMLSTLLKYFQEQQVTLNKIQNEVRELQEKIPTFLEQEDDTVKKEESLEMQDFSTLEEIKDSNESCPENFWRDVNSPDNLKKYLDDSSRMDSNFSLTSTQRGEDLLIHQGFKYRKKNFSPSILNDGRGVFKWRCARYDRKNGLCRGQIATTMDGLCILLDSASQHCHPPDQTSINSVLIRERIKEIAMNHPSMKTMDIIASAELLIPGGSTRKLREDKALHRYIQRIKAKTQQ